MKIAFSKLLVAAVSLGVVATANAQPSAVKVGVVLSTTGAGASVGIPEKNAITMWPTEVGGRKLDVIILDSRSDPSTATAAARRLVTEHNVDVLVGASIVPDTQAVAAVAVEAETPMLSIAPFMLPQDKLKWYFCTVPLTQQVASAPLEHMRKSGAKTVGFIGFSDSWGDQWLNELKAFATKSGIQIVAQERFGRTDTSVSGQVLKLLAAKPEAILVGGNTSGAGLVQGTLVDMRYQGKIYHTHGAVTPDFIRIAGKRGEGALAATAPHIVAEQLPETHPSKKIGIDLFQRYEARFGPGRNPFPPLTHDVGMLLEHIIPTALKSAQPGTREFRAAIRDAVESTTNLAVAQGVYNFSPSNHAGLDDRARVMVTVKDGNWRYLED